jgi:hypothetical protein
MSLLAVALILSMLWPTAAAAQSPPNAEITDAVYQLDEKGIWFWIDVTLNNLADEDVFVNVWFVYLQNDEYAQNAGPDDDYEAEDGTLVTYDVITPTIGRGYTDTVSVFVPYNAFPSVIYDYSYYPYIEVRSRRDNEQLASLSLKDQAIQVLGSEDPLGYLVWLSIRDLTVVDGEDTFLDAPEDEVLLLYALNEITRDEYWDAWDLHAWGVYVVDTGESVGADYFPWLLVDSDDDSTVWASFAVTEVDDLTQAQATADRLNDAVTLGVGITGPFALVNPYYAAGAAVMIGIVSAAKLTIDIIAVFQEDHLLGEPAESFSPAQLRALGESGETWDQTYRLFGTGYEYRLTVSLYVQPYYRHQPRD